MSWPSEVSESVSLETSALKPRASSVIAVRQTPETAIESPSCTSAEVEIGGIDIQAHVAAARFEPHDAADGLDDAGEHQRASSEGDTGYAWMDFMKRYPRGDESENAPRHEADAPPVGARPTVFSLSGL